MQKANKLFEERTRLIKEWGEDYGDGGYDPNDSPEAQGQEDFYNNLNNSEKAPTNSMVGVKFSDNPFTQIRKIVRIKGDDAFIMSDIHPGREFQWPLETIKAGLKSGKFRLE